MWKYENSLETDAEIEKLWALYSNINLWTKWDEGLEDVTLNGQFIAGSTGMIKPKGQNWLKYTLTIVHPLKDFSDELEIPGTDILISFHHMLTKLFSGKTRITHSVSIVGNDSDKLGKQMGPSLVSGIPEAMKNIASLAKKAGVNN